jgi:hypothetical protein
MSLCLRRSPRAADPKRYTASTSGKAENLFPSAVRRDSNAAVVAGTAAILLPLAITIPSYRNTASLTTWAMRINVTFPERALTELDACAKSIGETRSGFLLRAALEFIARHPAA